VAASAFEEAASSGMGVETGCFGLTETGRPERWRTLLAKDATALVLWLDHADRAAIDLLASEPSLLGRFGEVFLSSALLGESAFRLPSSLAGRVSLIHPFAPPETFERHAWRTLAWFRANKIAPEDRFVAMNAFFAVTVTSDALGMPRSIQSRELFVERLEHMIGPSPHRSAYASLSVNALHRYASAAFRIVKAPAENGGSPTKVEE
jgi:hypothetical protein